MAPSPLHNGAILTIDAAALENGVLAPAKSPLRSRITTSIANPPTTLIPNILLTVLAYTLLPILLRIDGYLITKILEQSSLITLLDDVGLASFLVTVTVWMLTFTYVLVVSYYAAELEERSYRMALGIASGLTAVGVVAASILVVVAGSLVCWFAGVR